MAFDLKANNNLATPSLVSPSGQLATAATFIDPYSYAMQYQPDLLPELHLQKGKGRILKFCQLTGSEKDYASDVVQHAELGDLFEAHTGVTVAGDVFTTSTAHNYRVNDKVIISDGTIEKQAIVSAVNSTTEFVGENIDAGAFGFANTNTGPVTVTKLSNGWNKGEENFTEGRKDTPEYIKNYSHILKEFYEINESDMAHNIWIEAPMFPGGEGWYNIELNRTLDMYDNLLEFTHLLNRRAADTSAAAVAGKAKGMKGVVQQVEERGNIGNEYITTLDQLSGIAFRIKQQGAARVYTVWADHTQMAYFRTMMAGANSHFTSGANYGIFQNSKDMALSLDFNSVTIDGITFHFTYWSLLDEPNVLGAEKFVNTAPAAIFVPAGDANVLDGDGNTYSSPYLNIRYRRKGGINRYKKIDFFGGSMGTPHKKDTFEMHIKTEQTNQVIGANQYFVVRRGTGIYTGS